MFWIFCGFLASFCHCTEETHDVGDAATCHHHACIHQSLGDDLALPYPLEEACDPVCLLGFLNKGHALAELGCNVGHGIDVDAVVANACGDGDDEFACQLRRNLRDDLLYEPGLHGKQDDIVESRIYSNGKMDFFFASRTSNNPSGRFFYCDYYTVYNGSDITIRIISSNDNIKDSELEIVKSVADSIRFPEKRKFSFSALNGKSVFVSFVIISVLFVLVVVYRRHDEKVNAFMMDKAVKLKQRMDKNKKDDDDTEPADDFGASQENESVSKSADNSNSSEPNDSDTEDDDLSSIDLDAAIALFDDSKK